MAEPVTVARPYAKAAFKVAKESNVAERWSNMLKFSSAVIQDHQVAQALDNPQLTADKKAEAFIKICGEQLDSAGQNFVKQLAQNKRLYVLPYISTLFEKLLAEERRKEDVFVSSAFDLSAAEKDGLKKALEKKLGKDVNLQSKVDKSLIGGVIIRAGDMIIDSSVRGKLQTLLQALK